MTETSDHGMWLPQAQDPRMQQSEPARGERANVLSYLEHFRTTLELKCDGLDTAQMGTRSVPPSNISMLGLVRHMARVEQSWFRRVLEGRMDLPRLFQGNNEDAGFNWDGEPDDTLVDEAWALWRAEVAHAREVIERSDFDTLVDVHGEIIEVREVLVHMVEEYARHCGHADLVRECLDGRTGQ